jgi:hypothetical protein
MNIFLWQKASLDPDIQKVETLLPADFGEKMSA